MSMKKKINIKINHSDMDIKMVYWKYAYLIIH